MKRKRLEQKQKLNWNMVTAISTAITAIIAIAAFVLGLISCTKFL